MFGFFFLKSCFLNVWFLNAIFLHFENITKFSFYTRFLNSFQFVNIPQRYVNILNKKIKSYGVVFGDFKII